MYRPSCLFDRTPEEKRDMFISWKRSDQAFFASGACHILAYLFIQIYGEDKHKIIHINPAGKFPGHHVYVSDGEWAFDYNGWTKEKELLRLTEEAYETRYPGWHYERNVIDQSLENFCKENNHRLPWQYAYLPWERAYKYISQFESSPPKS